MTMPDSDGVQEVVRAKRFELVDDDGAVRGEMEIDASGSPILSLLNSNGVTQWVATVSNDGTPSLEFSDREGRTRLSVYVLSGYQGGDDTPTLRMYDQNGNSKMSVSVDRDASGLRMYDQNMNIRLFLSASDDGPPMLAMSDQNGKVRLAARLYSDGGPVIELIDESGRSRYINAR